MAKKSVRSVGEGVARDRADGSRKHGRGKSRGNGAQDATAKAERLSGKDYERELEKLHVELVKLQQWVVHKGLKVCIVFEGRDGAGKGGTIKALTERVSPRVFGSWRCPRRRSARSRRCTPSATSGTCPPPARSSSSTAAGTTARASSA
jgi:polyphosphate kinase 2 (PPK2 family)